MTETKWTPGPWRYSFEDGDDWGTVRAGQRWICQASNPAVKWEDLPTYREANTDPHQANAQLIAAAPDLYEALEMAAEALDKFSVGDDDLVTEAPILAARAALKKARGET